MPKKLLLADDSITIQKVVAIALSCEDYAITAVDNGEDAIAKARELRPDIVLADVVMPKRSGYEVCEALKSDEELKHVPVLLLAGTFEAFDENRAKAAQADGHIQKPFETQALIDRVNRLVGIPGSSPSSRSDAAASTQPSVIPIQPAGASVIRQAPGLGGAGGAGAGFGQPSIGVGLVGARPSIPQAAGAKPVAGGGFALSGPQGTVLQGQPSQGIPAPRPVASPPGGQRPMAPPPGARPVAGGRPMPVPAPLPIPGVQGVQVMQGARPIPGIPQAGPGRPPPPVPGKPGFAPLPPGSQGFQGPQAIKQGLPAQPAAARPPPPASQLSGRVPAAPGIGAARPASNPFAVGVVPAQQPRPPQPAPFTSERVSTAKPGELQPSFGVGEAIAPLESRNELEFEVTLQDAQRPQEQAARAAAAIPIPIKPSPALDGDALLREALSKATREMIEKIAWEVVPQLAETIIREELDRLIKERETKT